MSLCTKAAIRSDIGVLSAIGRLPMDELQPLLLKLGKGMVLWGCVYPGSWISLAVKYFNTNNDL